MSNLFKLKFIYTIKTFFLKCYWTLLLKLQFAIIWRNFEHKYVKNLYKLRPLFIKEPDVTYLCYLCKLVVQWQTPHGKTVWMIWVKRCLSRLLRLNPGAWGEYLTSQLLWVAAWLLVTRICHVYLLDELDLVFVFLVFLKEVRTLHRCKPRVTQGVVSFPSDIPRAVCWMMTN